MNVTLNTKYKLINQKTFISIVNIDDFSIYPIHPIQAILLSFFAINRNFKESCNEAALFFNQSSNEIVNKITPLINNKEIYTCLYKGQKTLFPIDILVTNQHYNGSQYKPSYFSCSSFNISKKLDVPLLINIMPIVNCSFDCKYCYADVKKKYHSMSIEDWERILYDAYKLGVEYVYIGGSDLFSYKHWKRLFNKMIEYGYRNELFSTKSVLKDEDILFLEGIDYEFTLQFSFDTIDENIMKKMIGRDQYYIDSILNCFRKLDRTNIN